MLIRPFPRPAFPFIFEPKRPPLMTSKQCLLRAKTLSRLKPFNGLIDGDPFRCDTFEVEAEEVRSLG